jgi:glucokinase
MRSALVDTDGKILRQRRTLTDMSLGPDQATGRLIMECRALMDDAMHLHGRVAAVGLGVAGKIDSLEGRVIFSPNLPTMNDYPLASKLQDVLELPVVMENDANVFGIGENRLGAGRGIENWIGLTLGTGVGGCLILGGRIWRGDHLGFVGEIGHMNVHPEGPRCACGLRGCLEAHASGSALRAGVEAAVSQGTLTEGKLFDFWKAGELTPEAIYACALNGEEVARSLFRRMGWALGLALASLFTVLGIRHAIIGGGVGAGWDQFIAPLRESLAEHSCMLDPSQADIRQSSLGDDAALLGSGFLAQGYRDRGFKF